MVTSSCRTRGCSSFIQAVLTCSCNPEVEHKTSNPSTSDLPSEASSHGLQVDQTLGFLDQLKEQHHEVASKTRQLHDKCERLVCCCSWHRCAALHR